MGGRFMPMMGSNPPGFLQMPEMSCGSKGRFDGGAWVACLCPLFCAKSICIKTNTATSANKAVRRYVMWRLPSKNTHTDRQIRGPDPCSLLLLLGLGPRAVVFRHLNFNCRVTGLY